MRPLVRAQPRQLGGRQQVVRDGPRPGGGTKDLVPPAVAAVAVAGPAREADLDGDPVVPVAGDAVGHVAAGLFWGGLYGS